MVGGSLGGLFHAIALRALGCEVEVFEKSAGLMNDRGAGIVLQGEVVEFFERYGVGTVEEIGVPVRDPSLPRPGRLVVAGRADAPGDDLLGHALPEAPRRLPRRAIITPAVA